jgi:hypothetical protein
MGAIEGSFNYELEDCFEIYFVMACYLKHQKCKVSNEFQSNKINSRASTAVSVSYIHMYAKIQIFFKKTDAICVSRPATCVSLAVS